MSRPTSSVLADDCTLDTHSSQGGRIVKNSPRPRFRRGSPRTVRGRSSTDAPTQLFNCHEGSGFESKKAFNAVISETARISGLGHDYNEPARPALKTFYSFPSVPQKSGDGVMGIKNLLVQPPAEMGMPKVHPGPNPPVASSTQSTGYHAMFKQPETNPITEEQLVNEVRGIYAGLVMVEKKCIEVDKQQVETGEEMSPSKWQALISLHRTLLYEHHDFFLASQHPSASPVLKRLADKYAMPARMWRYGIHSFLELLRQRLPGSLDHMLNFIYLAYSMMTLLLESVSTFRETWIECLGDLARYRMAVEESDMRDREVWAGVSRYWYNQYADRSPGNGRIQHHLAVLARPDALQQLFYYTKALVTVRPFPNARESIVLLFNTDVGKSLQQGTVPAFIATHGTLFARGSNEQFITCSNQFLSLLRRDINRLDLQGQQGVYITCCNFAALLGYGDADAVLAMEFAPKEGENVADAHFFAREWLSQTPPGQQTLVERAQLSHNDNLAHGSSQIAAQIAFQGSSLAFHTLSVFLDQIGDPTIYPSIHTSLAFIWCLALRPTAMQQLEQLIPWLGVTKFLNTLLRPDIVIPKIEDSSFPLMQDTTPSQLPEDFLIRGQAWSHLYYPSGFFEESLAEDDRPSVEEPSKPSIVIPRKHRCLWLGVRLATVCPLFSFVELLPNSRATG